MRQRIVHIDIETFSDVNLAKCGVYRYAESDCFQILFVAYAFDDGPIQIADLAGGDPFPQELLDVFSIPVPPVWRTMRSSSASAFPAI